MCNILIAPLNNDQKISLARLFCFSILTMLKPGYPQKDLNLASMHNLRHGNQHNYTQHNHTQHNHTQHNDILHKHKQKVAFSIITLRIMVECCNTVTYAECRYAVCCMVIVVMLSVVWSLSLC